MSIVQVHKITAGSQKEAELLDIISFWAKKIPHHDFTDFSNQITINEIIFCPIYEPILTTQYYSRTTVSKVRPYNGNMLGPGSPNTSPLLDVGEFKKQAITDIVHGSETIHTCGGCGGSGSNTCYTCNGKGRATCRSCSGSGRKNCFNCSGRGRTRCYSCGGSGQTQQSVSRYVNGTWQYVTQYASCTSCSGSGSKFCYSCMGGGTVSCNGCYGTGIATCSTCSGSGKVTCGGCKGSGRVVHYTEQTRKWDYRVLKDTIYHAEYHCGYFPEFKINDNLYRDVEDSFSDKSINEDRYKLEPDYFQETYNKLLTTSLKPEKMAVDGGAIILSQKSIINAIPAYAVNYTFEEEQYHLLCLEKNSTAYDNTGPIAKVRHQMVVDGKKYFKKKHFKKSWQHSGKAKEMDPDGFDSHVTTLYQKASAKIKSSYWVGIFTGIILLGYLALIFYTDAIQNEKNMIHDWLKDDKGYTNTDIFKSATGFGLLFLTLAFIQMRFFTKKIFARFGARISPEIARMALGLIGAVIPVLIAVIAVFLLHLTGLVSGIGSLFYNIFSSLL